MSNTGSRVNYPEEKGLSGSSYIKTKGDYQVNELRNYVLNFYDKYDRLEFLRRRGMRIAEDDWELARDVLRLEVQCGYVFIKELCEKLNISRAFGDLLSYEVAYYAEAKFIGGYLGGCCPGLFCLSDGEKTSGETTKGAGSVGTVSGASPDHGQQVCSRTEADLEGRHFPLCFSEEGKWSGGAGKSVATDLG